MKTDKPFVVVQLSDLHIGATWTSADPLARFRACVAAVRRHAVAPDVVVVSGDLADHGSAEEYAPVRDELATLGVPVHVVAGNHDDRRTLRACFELPGEADAPVGGVVDAGPLRLVLLDSTVPGENGGDLDPDRLHRLEAGLEDAPERPTIVVMHHPPLRTGAPAFDAIGLADGARLRLAGVLERHRQVRAVLAGHLHRTIVGTLGGCAALTIPSTYVQSRLDLAATELRLAEEEPPAFAIHTLHGGGLVSHVQPVV